MTEHQHEPLPDPGTYIRLITILEGTIDQPVRWALTIHMLGAAAPTYYAVSYTWGDALDTAVVLVNEKRMVVRRHCEYVLRQVYASGINTYVWVDAICIDQFNNTQEKSCQVAMMGDLYKQAEYILGILPFHTDLSSHMQITDAMCKHFKNLVPQRGCLSAGATPTQHPNHLRQLLKVLPNFHCQDPETRYTEFDRW
jgi:hypothetical protein